MCTECGRSEISRRRFIWTPPALLAASWLAGVEARAGGSSEEEPFDAICREAWGARPPSDDYRRHHIRRLTIHHSGVPFHRNRDAPARFRSMQADHQSEGWPDIAYHMLIDRHGNVYRARPAWAKGNTRTNYDPRGHLLVMCIGNFDEQEVPRRQLAAAIDVLAWACERFDVRPRTIGGHRDYASTACPGDNLHRLIENGAVRRRVRNRLDQVRMHKLCGREGRRRVRAIEQGRD